MRGGNREWKQTTEEKGRCRREREKHEDKIHQDKEEKTISEKSGKGGSQKLGNQDDKEKNEYKKESAINIRMEERNEEYTRNFDIIGNGR